MSSDMMIYANMAIWAFNSFLAGLLTFGAYALKRSND